MLNSASPTVRGMLWMAATGVLFTVLNATMKKLAHELDPWLVGFLRYLLGAGGHYCMTRAFRVADISAVQSVKFLELVWAALLGIAMFGTVPAGSTVAGGVVILASTLWLARREARAAARTA